MYYLWTSHPRMTRRVKAVHSPSTNDVTSISITIPIVIEAAHPVKSLAGSEEDVTYSFDTATPYQRHQSFRHHYRTQLRPANEPPKIS